MFEIGKDCQIDPTATINVREGKLGNRSIVGPHVVIEGNRVFIGEEAFLDAYAWIGGGSCHDTCAELVVGDWLHMGRYSHINIARPVTIGHEFGCGLGTRIFAHGAYLSAWEGFPVQWSGVEIGDSVWMPNAWVNPGVRIGSNVVIAARSLVNANLPSGCLAGGIPARVLRENVYPKELSALAKDRLFSDIVEQTKKALGELGSWSIAMNGSYFVGDDTLFDVNNRMITGKVTPFTEALKNQLRRNGIRFRYVAKGGEYVPWKKY